MRKPAGAMRPAALALLMGALFLSACPNRRDGSPSLAERLQGSWAGREESRTGEFTRVAAATLAVDRSSIKYHWNILWDCADTVCAAEPPTDSGGYFEGVFRDTGDSLALQDGTDSLAFPVILDSSLVFVVNGIRFTLRRNQPVRS